MLTIWPMTTAITLFFKLALPEKSTSIVDEVRL